MSDYMDRRRALRRESYQVQAGDTMTSIATSYGASLAAMNRANPGATPLDVGQRVRVPARSQEQEGTGGPTSRPGGGRPMFRPTPPPPSGGNFRPGLFQNAGREAIGGLTAMTREVLGVANAYVGRPLGSVLRNAALATGGAANYYGGQAARYSFGYTPQGYSGGVAGVRSTVNSRQYGPTSAPDYSQLGSLMQRVTRGGASTGDVDSYINNAILNGYVEENVAPALAPIINARTARYTGGVPLYDPSGAINPAAISGTGASGDGGGSGSSPTIIPGQPTQGGVPQEAYISPYIQGNNWRVVTEYDVERGVWVRRTLPTYGGRGRGGQGGGIGRYRSTGWGGGGGEASVSPMPISGFGLIDFGT